MSHPGAAARIAQARGAREADRSNGLEVRGANFPRAKARAATITPRVSRVDVEGGAAMMRRVLASAGCVVMITVIACGGSGTTKWGASQKALDNFFASPGSSGIHASLTFFGMDASLSSTPNANCGATPYETPEVAMEPLPNATDFSNAIAKTSPSTNTPTVGAEAGAIVYAQNVAASLKDGGKVAIVLVTDGDPDFCGSGNTVSAVAAEASKVAATIPTYVVGIGNSLTNLKTIASAGGTTAILVNTGSPDQLTGDLQAALGNIAKSQLGCNYALPAPPAGQTLDVNAVNVDYTPAGMATQTLPYSADCANANGWHYDSTSAPTTVVMCPTVCNTLKADDTGKVDIVFGCTTTVTPGGSLPLH
jgi:hypothetical protein